MSKLDLLALSFMRQRLHHPSNMLMLLWSLLMTALCVYALDHSALSSANWLKEAEVVTSFGMSLTRMIYSSGDNDEPWGVPASIWTAVENFSPTLTVRERFVCKCDQKKKLVILIIEK